MENAESGTSESIPSPVESSGANVSGTDISGMSTDLDSSVEKTFLYEHSSPPEAANGLSSDLESEKASEATPPTTETDSPVSETIISDSIGSENNSSDPPSGPLDKADSIPGYEILGELGRGGMGVVYRARHMALNRTVALKMILAGGHASEEQLARFRAEAESVAQLHHPNIVEVYDIGEQRGLPFFSQEYIDGKSLKDEIAGKPQRFKNAAGMVETIALAMHYAHRHGIVHRDLKPENVLLSKDGVLKVMDFGLAKNLDSDSSQTRTGTIMGTPNYMAPEQGRGEKQVGPLADVYALGAILYEMTTGRPPFLAATAVQTLTLLLNQEAVPPSQLQPNIPADLETITLKCLQKDPQKRYATAKELADDLRHFILREPILARPVSRVERVWRWCRRNKLVAGLTATAVLLLVGMAVGGTTAAIIVNEQKNIAKVNERIALVQKGLAKENELRANQNKELAEQKEQEANKMPWLRATHKRLPNAARTSLSSRAVWLCNRLTLW
jgi:predicted Ser/Thr protein kinase